jgi:hypothetical protein
MRIIRKRQRVETERGLVRPASIGRPLPTRDVKALIVAQAILEEVDAVSAADAKPTKETLPSEVELWARRVLGQEVCTCSIHCPRPS